MLVSGSMAADEFADRLGLPNEVIHLRQGDTDLIAAGGGHGQVHIGRVTLGHLGASDMLAISRVLKPMGIACVGIAGNPVVAM